MVFIGIAALIALGCGGRAGARARTASAERHPGIVFTFSLG
jgi:hypothetical protein